MSLVTITNKSNNNFPKTERLHKTKSIEELFAEGSYFYLYPYKVIYRFHEQGDSNQIMVSVPKRKFKSAVKRNRLRRQIKEAYRLNKEIISEKKLQLAFIYTPGKLMPYSFLSKRMVKSLEKLKPMESPFG